MKKKTRSTKKKKESPSFAVLAREDGSPVVLMGVPNNKEKVKGRKINPEILFDEHAIVCFKTQGVLDRLNEAQFTENEEGDMFFLSSILEEIVDYGIEAGFIFGCLPSDN